LPTIAILDGGAVDAYAELAPVRIGQDVPLAAGDLLARVVALGVPF
jgi:hypothetical protein